MQYEEGEYVKIISIDRVKQYPKSETLSGEYYSMPGQSWATPEMDRWAGTVQKLESVSVNGYYNIKGWAFSPEAIERRATPTEIAIFLAEPKPFRGPLVAEIMAEAEKNKTRFDKATIEHSPYPFAKVTLKEMVNHPAHYGGEDNPYEVCKVVEAWGLGWHLGSAVKYIGRAGKKDPAKEKEDLEKAIWYIQRKILLLGISLLLCLFSFGQSTLDSLAIMKNITIRPAPKQIVYDEYTKDGVEFLKIKDSAGVWFSWNIDSPVLILTPPCKIRYILYGKKLIKL